MSQKHKAGFVSIVGKPNAGKSTLMNKLVGEHLSIITSKAQTTRHRIMGILNGDDFQIVYSDTPGLLEPQYALQKAMMRFVSVSLEDADIVLLVVDPYQTYDPTLFSRLNSKSTHLLVVLNKIDLVTPEEVEERLAYWKNHLTAKAFLSLSALTGAGIDVLMNHILGLLPEHPEYYPKDELTDKSERFFASEIIREQIFRYYAQEIPYSAEVHIDVFKDEIDILRIRAIIYVERSSQKGILIGKGGQALKAVGTKARLQLEDFFSKKVFLETYVKVAENWRRRQDQLKQFGYRDQ